MNFPSLEVMEDLQLLSTKPSGGRALTLGDAFQMVSRWEMVLNQKSVLASLSRSNHVDSRSGIW